MKGDFQSLLETAHRTGDYGALVKWVPASRFLGITAERQGDRLVTRLAFAPHLVGNALIPALHGGTIGALLESAAFFQLLWEMDFLRAPRIINITVEYLRTARTMDTFAGAEITRQGRRVATVRATAWQEDPDRPVAAANAHFLLTPRDETEQST